MTDQINTASQIRNALESYRLDAGPDCLTPKFFSVEREDDLEKLIRHIISELHGGCDIALNSSTLSVKGDGFAFEVNLAPVMDAISSGRVPEDQIERFMVTFLEDVLFRARVDFFDKKQIVLPLINAEQKRIYENAMGDHIERQKTASSRMPIFYRQAEGVFVSPAIRTPSGGYVGVTPDICERLEIGTNDVYDIGIDNLKWSWLSGDMTIDPVTDEMPWRTVAARVPPASSLFLLPDFWNNQLGSDDHLAIAVIDRDLILFSVPSRDGSLRMGTLKRALGRRPMFEQVFRWDGRIMDKLAA